MLCKMMVNIFWVNYTNTTQQAIGPDSNYMYQMHNPSYWDYIIIIFTANKTLGVKQYNTIQHYKTYIHEQHKEMSYIHS